MYNVLKTHCKLFIYVFDLFDIIIYNYMVVIMDAVGKPLRVYSEPNYLVAIVGGAVGGAVALLVIVIVTVVVICRSRRRRRSTSSRHLSTAVVSVIFIHWNSYEFL